MKVLTRRPDKQLFIFICNILLLVTLWASIYTTLEKKVDFISNTFGEWTRYTIFFSCVFIIIILNYKTMGGWCVPHVV